MQHALPDQASESLRGQAGLCCGFRKGKPHVDGFDVGLSCVCSSRWLVLMLGKVRSPFGGNLAVVDPVDPPGVFGADGASNQDAHL